MDGKGGTDVLELSRFDNEHFMMLLDALSSILIMMLSRNPCTTDSGYFRVLSFRFRSWASIAILAETSFAQNTIALCRT